MNAKEFEDWVKENGTCATRKYSGGIDWVFVTMKDGWIAIFEYNYFAGEYIPKIQAKDEKHALNYISLIERPPVPFQIL